MDGVNTMFSWYNRGVGGILADEMGLGKTIQTITLLATLKHKLGVAGPHLVIAPLAVLQVTETCTHAHMYPNTCAHTLPHTHARTHAHPHT